MARTDSTSVEGVLGSDYNGTTVLTPYITAANLIVTRMNECAVRKGYTISDTELLTIETWLAAHAYVQMDQTLASKSTQQASASFHGQTAMNFDNSKYGQMAQSIDPSSCLSALNKRQRASLNWLGKTETEQIDYADRMQ